MKATDGLRDDKGLSSTTVVYIAVTEHRLPRSDRHLVPARQWYVTCSLSSLAEVKCLETKFNSLDYCAGFLINLSVSFPR